MEKCLSICGQCLRLNFSRNAFLRKSLHLDSKTDLTTDGLNWSVFVGVVLGSLLSYLHRLKSARVSHLCFLSTIWCLFDKYFEGYSGLFFKCAILFSHRFSNIDWRDFSMQYNFTLFACASLSLLFLQVVMKRLSIYFWKPIFLFSDFFNVNCLLMVYPVYHCSCFLNLLLESNTASARWWPF